MKFLRDHGLFFVYAAFVIWFTATTVAGLPNMGTEGGGGGSSGSMRGGRSSGSSFGGGK